MKGNYVFSENRYDTMQYNRCGHSGLRLPKISLGCWHNFGEPDNLHEARRMLHYAFDNGITHFDLANNYGPPPGHAESYVGKILQEDFSNHRDELIISSKSGHLMWPGPYGEWGSRKNMIASLDQSLKRLKLDYVDIFYSHRFDPNTPLEETIGALDQIVRQGKALYVGISKYDSENTLKAVEIAKSLGTPLTIHQPSYNMFNRDIENGLLDTCSNNGLGVIAFCPLAQGLLTDKYLDSIPQESRISKEHGFLKESQLDEKKLNKLKQLNELANNREQTLAQMSLAWVARDPKVTSVLIGASRRSQIEDNLKILESPSFTQEELETIDEILN